MSTNVKPLVTVVIPCFNYQDKVARAIRSVQEQTLSNLECFVVDNNSTDGSKGAILSTIDGDSRFYYVNCNEQGVAHARNMGVAMGSGVFYCCLDADDAIATEFLEACVRELEKDPSLGVAFTGLWYIKPDGTEGLSPWPGEFNYDKQLMKQNGIPTCHVGRRSMWLRLGGQKQRYAPGGAGAEDGEFILRMGAYGWGAKKVTDAGLFRYSWLSGRVSGNKQYNEPDWLVMHPFVKDGKHPFASLATPENKLSHPVRQYDEPDVSVIIPVGPNHFSFLPDALDSLESQTFRRWEAIAVLDFEAGEAELSPVKTAYPYVRWVEAAPDVHGSGRARNRGAEIARAPLLLFLDCDDMLFPEAIEKLVSAYRKTGNIVYSDYLGKAYMAPEDAKKLGNRLHSYDEKKSEAVIHHSAFDYECEVALRQPDTSRIYIWNLITSIVPAAWHRQIGGFDERMESWEDWDYWLRLARRGKCFTHIPEELVVYYFYTGTRRDRGIALNQHLLQYLADKYRGVEAMPCNCGSANRQYKPVIVQPVPRTAGGKAVLQNMSDEEFVLVEYLSHNRGSHKVVGAATKKFLGYRSGGDRFYVPRADLKAMSNLFREISNVVEPPAEEQKPLPPPQVMEAPKPVSQASASFAEVNKFLTGAVDPVPPEFRLAHLAGVTPQIEKSLLATGRSTAEDIIEFGIEGLKTISGVGDIRADAIFASAKAYLDAQADKDAEAD